MFAIHGARSTALFIAACVTLAGCSMNVPVDPQVNAERATKIDRLVAVYISEDTRTTTWSENRYGDTWNFPLGPSSAPAIREAARRTFRQTASVDELPPLGPGAPDVDAVLEARIEDFSFVIPLLKTSTYRADIAYRFTLHDERGAPVASWRVEGEGERRGQLGFEYTRWPGEAAERAIEDAMRKFVEGADDEPEVKKWLRDGSGSRADGAGT